MAGRWLPLAAFLQGSCVALDEIPADECGNNVVEVRSDGVQEDCDGFVDTSKFEVVDGKPPLCGEAGQSHACKYTFDATHNCPAAWLPGSDGRCRLPSGNFNDFGRPVGIYNAAKPLVADFNGDGEQDILAKQTFIADPSQSLQHVSYFSGGEVSDAVELRNLAGVGVGSLRQDAAADIAFGVLPEQDGSEPSDQRAALAVQLGRSDVGFDLKFYANGLFPGEATYIALPLNTVPNFPFPDWDLSPVGVVYPNDDPNKCNGESLCLCLDLSCDVRIGILGPLNERAKVVSDTTDEFMALSALGANGIVHVTSFGASFVPIGLKLQNPLAKIISEPKLDDLDGDGHLDLAVVATVELPHGPNEPTMYRTGLYYLAGKFDTNTNASLPWTGSDELVRIRELGGDVRSDLTFGGQTQAAIGFFNGDALMDVVYTTEDVPDDPDEFPSQFGLVEFGTMGAGELAGFTGVGPFQIADLNGDGLDDIVSNAYDPTGNVGLIAETFGGDVKPLVSSLTPITGQVIALGAADIDGDTADDLIVGLSTVFVDPTQPRLCEPADDLYVIYGRVGGFPEAPRAIGQTTGIRQIFARRFFIADGADGIGDFAISGACEEPGNESAAIVQGRTDRVLFAPYVSESEAFYSAFHFVGDVGLGPKGGGDQGHADIVAFGIDGLTPGVRIFYGAGDADLVEESETLSLPGYVGTADAMRRALDVDAVITPSLAPDDATTTESELAFAVATNKVLPDMTTVYSLAFGARSIRDGEFTETLAVDEFDVATSQPGAVLSVRLVGADVDEDGDMDYVAVLGGAQSLYALDTAAEEGATPTSVAVAFEREGNGFEVHVLTEPFGGVFTDAAIFRTPTGSAIAVAGDSVIHRLNPTTFELDSFAYIGVSSGGGDDGSSDIGGYFGLSGIAMADFSGDGLDDLLVLSDVATIYEQKAWGDP